MEYTIHVLNNKLVAFALTPDKTLGLYERLFSEIKHIVNNNILIQKP